MFKMMDNNKITILDSFFCYLDLWLLEKLEKNICLLLHSSLYFD